MVKLVNIFLIVALSMELAGSWKYDRREYIKIKKYY